MFETFDVFFVFFDYIGCAKSNLSERSTIFLRKRSFERYSKPTNSTLRVSHVLTHWLVGFAYSTLCFGGHKTNNAEAPQKPFWSKLEQFGAFWAVVWAQKVRKSRRVRFWNNSFTMVKHRFSKQSMFFCFFRLHWMCKIEFIWNFDHFSKKTILREIFEIDQVDTPNRQKSTLRVKSFSWLLHAYFLLDLVFLG